MHKITILKSYFELGSKAADYIEKTLLLPKSSIIFPTGSTPISMYKELVKRNLNWSNTTTYTLDEYIQIKDSKKSYFYYMNKNLFNHTNISSNKTNFLDYKTFSKTKDYGFYADLCILGIGRNGHIAFNEPGGSFDSETRIVELSKQTRKDNSRFFKSIQEVPLKAVTMGLKPIMSSKKIVLLAKGKSKKEILEKAIFGEITEKIPASILQKHDNLKIYYCD